VRFTGHISKYHVSMNNSDVQTLFFEGSRLGDIKQSRIQSLLRLSPLNICNFHWSNHRLPVFDQFHVTQATDVQIFLSKISGQQLESVFWVVESINQNHLRFPEHPNSKHSFCLNSGQGRQWNDVDSGGWELDPLRLDFLSKTLFVQGFW